MSVSKPKKKQRKKAAYSQINGCETKSKLLISQMDATKNRIIKKTPINNMKTEGRDVRNKLF